MDVEGFEFSFEDGYASHFDGQKGHLLAVSSERVLAVVPESSERVSISLESGLEFSDSFDGLIVGKKIIDGMHIVANPAIDPKDGSLIITKSGSRGMQLPVTMFRLETSGFLEELEAHVMNPTGIAFDSTGQMFVTNRADGMVYRIGSDGNAIPFADELGVATGIAFNKRGEMFVGDRSGTIYRVSNIGNTEVFAELEPSVAAYHLAFGKDGALYVTAPSVASFDAVYRIDQSGNVSTFFRGLGRPQGLAFDTEGNLYVAACLRGKRGIVRIDQDGKNAEIIVSGMNIVGLCFSKKGEMFVATNEEIHRLDLGIYGLLLD